MIRLWSTEPVHTQQAIRFSDIGFDREGHTRAVDPCTAEPRTDPLRFGQNQPRGYYAPSVNFSWACCALAAFGTAATGLLSGRVRRDCFRFLCRSLAQTIRRGLSSIGCQCTPTYLHSRWCNIEHGPTSGAHTRDAMPDLPDSDLAAAHRVFIATIDTVQIYHAELGGRRPNPNRWPRTAWRPNATRTAAQSYRR